MENLTMEKPMTDNSNFVHGFDSHIFSIDLPIRRPRFKRSQILKAIGCPHLKLHSDNGYFTWTYDTYPDDYDYQEYYGDEDVDVPYLYIEKVEPIYQLNHMSLEKWIERGKDFAKENDDYLKTEQGLTK